MKGKRDPNSKMFLPAGSYGFIERKKLNFLIENKKMKKKLNIQDVKARVFV